MSVSLEETIKNLVKAFIDESQARNRYTLYAKVAKKEGYEQIAEIFSMTAENEREHASTLFKLINELTKGKVNAVKVEAEALLTLSTTAENLKAAIAGENHEHTQLYPRFADVAEREGLKEIADRLRAIARAEEHHEERYKKLLKEIEAGTVFRKEKEVWWVCRECGYVHFGREPPERCPSCDHPKSYFQPRFEQY